MRTRHHKKTNAETNAPPPTDAGDAAQAVNGQERRRSKKRKSKSIEDPVGDGLSFWEFTASLGDRWLSGDLKTVIYRTWPRIDKQQDKVYLSIVQEAPSEESLLQAYGSGRYLMFIKDKGKLLRKHVVSVSHPAYPPKVNESEVVRDDPANEAYFRGWARKSNKDDPEKKEPVAGGDINSVLTTVLEKAGSFDPKLAELWQSTAQQRDELSKALAAKNAPPDFVTQVKGLKEICPTLFEPPAAPPPAPTQQLDTLTLLKLVKELQPAPQNPLQILEQAKNIFAPEGTGENPKTDEISRLDQILTFATKLANLRVGNGGHRDGWEIGLDYGRDLGVPILQMIQNVMSMRTGGMMPPLAAPGASVAVPNAAFDPYKNPELMRNFARSMNAQTAPAPPASTAGTGPSVPADATPNPAAQAPPANELGALVQMYGGLVLGQLNMGTPGYVFADHITALTGNATHAQICAQGEPALLQALLAVPEISMFGEARLKKWVHEFVAFEEFLDAEEEGEQAAAAAGKE